MTEREQFVDLALRLQAAVDGDEDAPGWSEGLKDVAVVSAAAIRHLAAENETLLGALTSPMNTPERTRRALRLKPFVFDWSSIAKPATGRPKEG